MRMIGVMAGIHGFLAVAVGAFAAHLARARLAPENLEWLETGARYQLVHAVAMLALAALAQGGTAARLAGIAFAVGIVIFSGSLYALALGG